jgi:hypothetical protein
MRFLVLVINLDRRADRRAWMEQTLRIDESCDELSFVQAADGQSVAKGDGEFHHHGFHFSPMQGWALSDTVGFCRFFVCVAEFATCLRVRCRQALVSCTLVYCDEEHP